MSLSARINESLCWDRLVMTTPRIFLPLELMVELITRLMSRLEDLNNGVTFEDVLLTVGGERFVIMNGSYNEEMRFHIRRQYFQKKAEVPGWKFTEDGIVLDLQPDLGKFCDSVERMILDAVSLSDFEAKPHLTALVNEIVKSENIPSGTVDDITAAALKLAEGALEVPNVPKEVLKKAGESHVETVRASLLARLLAARYKATAWKSVESR